MSPLSALHCIMTFTFFQGKAVSNEATIVPVMLT
jgi:hypothetical protein